MTAIAMESEGVQTNAGLQGRLNQANGTGVALRGTVVSLIPSLPDAVIGHPVGATEVINEVLNEGGLGAIAHHHQA